MSVKEFRFQSSETFNYTRHISEKEPQFAVLFVLTQLLTETY
jgi:hypothetical protein